jgi:hypothetical protein
MSKRLSGQQPEHDGYGKPAVKKTKANNDVKADPDGSITAIVTANDSSQGKVGQPKKAIQLDTKLVKLFDDAKIILATARRYNASEKQINADLKEHFKQDITKGFAIRDHAVAKIKQDREKTGFLKNTFDEKLQEVKAMVSTGDLTTEQQAFLSYVRKCGAEELAVNEKFLVAMANGIKFFRELIVHKEEDWALLQRVVTLMNEAEGEMLEEGEDVKAYARADSQTMEDESDDDKSVAPSLPKAPSPPEPTLPPRQSSGGGAGAGAGVCAGYTRTLTPSLSAEASTAKVLEESAKKAEELLTNNDPFTQQLAMRRQQLKGSAKKDEDQKAIDELASGFGEEV